MGYDVAIGASQNQLNAIAATLYEELHGQLFTGSIDVPTLNLVVDYDVEQAPSIDLTPPTAEERTVLAQRLYQSATEAVAERAMEVRVALASFIDSQVLFSVTSPDIKVTLKTADGKMTSLKISATATCDADINATTGEITLAALDVAVPQWSDPTVKWILENVISPEVKKTLNAYLDKIRLPPLTIAGVALSSPIVVVQNATLIALTTLQRNGPPTPPPDGTAWPQTDFFSLLDRDVVNAAAAYQVAQLNPRFDKGGSASWTAFKVSWRAQLTLGNPNISIGDSFHLALQLGGGVNAGLSVDLIFKNPSVSFGVDFSTNPDPGGSVRVDVNSANAIRLSILKVDPFGISIRLPGLPGWANVAIGWVTGIITQGLTTVVVAAVNEWLVSNLNFTVYSIPAIPIKFDPVDVKIEAQDLSISAFSGMLAATGMLKVVPA